MPFENLVFRPQSQGGQICVSWISRRRRRRRDGRARACRRPRRPSRARLGPRRRPELVGVPGGQLGGVVRDLQVLLAELGLELGVVERLDRAGRGGPPRRAAAEDSTAGSNASWKRAAGTTGPPEKEREPQPPATPRGDVRSVSRLSGSMMATSGNHRRASSTSSTNAIDGR